MLICLTNVEVGAETGGLGTSGLLGVYYTRCDSTKLGEVGRAVAVVFVVKGGLPTDSFPSVARLGLLSTTGRLELAKQDTSSGERTH